MQGLIAMSGRLLELAAWRTESNFGLCPRCHKTDGIKHGQIEGLIDAKDAWGVCHRHKVKWWITRDPIALGSVNNDQLLKAGYRLLGYQTVEGWMPSGEWLEARQKWREREDSQGIREIQGVRNRISDNNLNDELPARALANKLGPTDQRGRQGTRLKIFHQKSGKVSVSRVLDWLLRAISRLRAAIVIAGASSGNKR
jgi:hypothetical protein